MIVSMLVVVEGLLCFALSSNILSLISAAFFWVSFSSRLASVIFDAKSSVCQCFQGISSVLPRCTSLGDESLPLVWLLSLVLQ